MKNTKKKMVKLSFNMNMYINKENMFSNNFML